ncbi:hypothetical protein [Mucilaginibacter lacusdianchii]|uniref:hypothetical protein n=1 Tax=Mucilaginibacter lacusdianchii TaxID=2684211 RepID=UPI00131D0C07|nr:hypothetical protein [Mucilaginibacter sp. JXJ CY 39]
MKATGNMDMIMQLQKAIVPIAQIIGNILVVILFYIVFLMVHSATTKKNIAKNYEKVNISR